MALNDNYAPLRYVVTDNQSRYPITWPFSTPATIVVKLAAASDMANATTLVLGTNYSVEQTATGGTLVLSGQAGFEWRYMSIARSEPYTQPMAMNNTSTLDLDALEKLQDHTVMLTQQNRDMGERSIKVPAGSSETPEELADKLLGAEETTKKYRDEAIAAAGQSQLSATASAISASEAATSAADALATEKRVATMGDAAVADIQATSQKEQTDIRNLGSQYQTDIELLGNAKKQEVTTEGDTQVGRVVAAGNEQVLRVNAAGQTNTDTVNNAGAQQTAAVNAAGDATVVDVNYAGEYQISRVQGIALTAVQEVKQEVVRSQDAADASEASAVRSEEWAKRSETTALGELPRATESVDGIVRLATYEEAVAGVKKDIAVSPLRMSQAFPQISNSVLKTPTVTGPDSVREYATVNYTFSSEVLLDAAKVNIVEFGWYIDEVTATPTIVPVPTPSPVATVTAPVKFPNGYGTKATLIVFARDSNGNISRYADKVIVVRLNEPPDVTNMVTNISVRALQGSTTTARTISGATDADGDAVTYEIDWGDTGITSSLTSGITDNQAFSVTLPNDPVKYPPSPDHIGYTVSYTIYAVDEFGGRNGKRYTMTIMVAYDAPTIQSPVNGATGVDPRGPVVCTTNTFNGNPTAASAYLCVQTSNTNDFSTYEEYNGALNEVQLAVNMPYNKRQYLRAAYTNAPNITYKNWSNVITIDTSVTVPKAVLTVKDGANCTGNIVSSGATVPVNSITATTYRVSTVESAAVPTGETVSRLLYEVADNQSFTDASSFPNADRCVNAFKYALDAGKISAAVPAKPAYLRARYQLLNAGPENSTILGPWSDIFTLNLLAASLTAPVCATPVNGAVNQLETSVTMTWVNGTPVGQTIDAVQIQVATDANFANTVKDSGAFAVTTSWSAVDFALNTTYYWRVRNRGTATGWSNWSNAFHFKTFVDKFVAGPILKAPVDQQDLIPRLQPLTVSWNAARGATGAGTLTYIVNVYTDTWELLYSNGNIPASSTSFAIPANTFPNAYTWYRVQVVATFTGNTAGSESLYTWVTTANRIRTSPGPVEQGFTATTTYTVPYDGIYQIQVIGAGGGAGENSQMDDTGAGGGGGAGGYCRVTDLRLNAGTQLNITVGSGGAYGTNGNAGGVGGTTSVTWGSGPLIQATGGGGGGAPVFGDVNGKPGGGGGGPYSNVGTVPEAYQGTSGGRGNSSNTAYCNTPEPGTGSACSGNACGNDCSGTADHQIACQYIPSPVDVWIYNKLSGGGGAICTNFGKNFGGGGGYPGGNDGGDRLFGQNGAAHIQSMWSQ